MESVDTFYVILILVENVEFVFVFVFRKKNHLNIFFYQILFVSNTPPSRLVDIIIIFLMTKQRSSFIKMKIFGNPSYLKNTFKSSRSLKPKINHIWMEVPLLKLPGSPTISSNMATVFENRNFYKR